MWLRGNTPPGARRGGRKSAVLECPAAPRERTPVDSGHPAIARHAELVESGYAGVQAAPTEVSMIVFAGQEGNAACGSSEAALIFGPDGRRPLAASESCCSVPRPRCGTGADLQQPDTGSWVC